MKFINPIERPKDFPPLTPEEEQEIELDITKKYGHNGKLIGVAVFMFTVFSLYAWFILGGPFVIYLIIILFVGSVLITAVMIVLKWLYKGEVRVWRMVEKETAAVARWSETSIALFKQHCQEHNMSYTFVDHANAYEYEYLDDQGLRHRCRLALK